MNDFSIITSGSMATFVLEFVKLLIRWRKPNFEFPVKFYVFLLPVVTFAVQPLLAWLGVPALGLPTEWVEWIKTFVLVVLSSGISLLVYEGGLGPFKDYVKERLS